ncbi:UDP-N-acetylmuramoyl-tripeptide--D-alanyl-D-alanine ligase, partial [Patescibacteria group bacterium]|nr:UDP-N-acetylmuramoyl-tripeptide--D-alanyl-D-alanine ligase [Patescibacteria group bacterium]
KPKIIAVTGTVGKTSSKDAIYTILSPDFHVRKSEKSYNSELGVPLTIIGAKTAWNNFFEWFLILFKGFKLLIAKYDYPKWLVLEMGVDRPKDMKRLVSYVKPEIAVITTLGEVPVHVEYFKNPEEVAKEKSRLAQAIKKEGHVILNADDNLSLSIREKVKAKILTFGFSDEADLTASNYHIVYKKEVDQDIPEGITFKVDYKGNIIPVRLFNIFGKQAVYTALSSMAVATAMGMNLVETAEALSRYKPPAGRLRLLEGIKNTFILDDSYNSSPIAVQAALEVLAEIPAKRKIVVLGDMLELGKFTIDEHKKIGKSLKKLANYIFTVGPRAKFIAEEARQNGFKENYIFEFSTADEAKMEVQKKIKEGDLILIKGSQSMKMEKITEEIMAHPENKEELLVRQELEWQNKC